MTIPHIQPKEGEVTRPEIAGLVERLEAATGPDRELDADIAWTFDRERWRNAYWNATTGKPKDKTPDELVGMGRRAVVMLCPNVSESIDAALALADRKLPGWRWGIGSMPRRVGTYPDGKPAYGDGFTAHFTELSAIRPMPSIGKAPTAPLALLIALLKALEQKATAP